MTTVPDTKGGGPPKGNGSAGPSQTADVHVSQICIENLRGIDTASLTLSDRATFLVGENNAGKTSILQALSIAFGARQASRDDLRQSVAATAGSATIDIFLSPARGPSFAEATRQHLQTIQRRPDASRSEVVAFRTTLSPSHERPQLNQVRTFLQPVRGGWVESQARFRPEVLQLVDVHLLDASRDLISELGNRSSTWGRVVADLQVPELAELADGRNDPGGRAGLEEELSLFAGRLRKASPVLQQLEKDLRRLSDSQTTLGDVELLALPPRIEDLARAIEVVIKQRDDTTLPLRFHGLGSRSLASLLVFQTMCTLRVGMDQGIRPHLVTLLEEPEAHLHPQAVVALRDVIGHLDGQAVVTTHSPQLVAELPPGDVRLIRRTTAGMRVLSLPPATAKKIAQFRKFVERPLGEIFFARLVVFGDGASERNALPVLLAPRLGGHPAGMGITFIDCESMEGPKLAKVVEALHELETAWLVFADNDESGTKALSHIIDPGSGKPLDFDHDNVVRSGDKQIEQLLIDAGYTEEVTTVASEVGSTVASEKEALAFLKSNKGWAVEAVARAAIAAQKTTPQPIEDLAVAIEEKLKLAEVEAPPS